MTIHVRMIYCLLAASVCTAVACTSDGHMGFLGYTTAPNYDSSIRSIYVPIEKNKTMARGLEFDLTLALLRQIQTKTPYKIVDRRSEADTEMICKLSSRTKQIINFNQIGEIREGQVTLTIEVIWRDLRLGHEGNLLSGKGTPAPVTGNANPLRNKLPDENKKDLPVLVVPSATFQPELGGSITTVHQELVNKAAVQIVSMMEIWR